MIRGAQLKGERFVSLLNGGGIHFSSHSHIFISIILLSSKVVVVIGGDTRPKFSPGWGGQIAEAYFS